MKPRKLELATKLDIGFTNLAIAIPMVVCINLFYFLLAQWKPIEEIDYMNLSLIYDNGYFVFNNIIISFSIYFNIILVTLLWYLMVSTVLKNLNQPITAILPFMNKKAILRIAHLFFFLDKNLPQT
jgi:hypothetical protein